MSNLNEAIHFYLSGEKPNFVANPSNEIRTEIEALFEKRVECDGKSGCYQKKEEGEEPEDIQFFNYTIEGGWWFVDESEGTEAQYYLLGSDGKIVSEESVKSLTNERLSLLQFKNYAELAKYQFKKYDYAMLLIYSKDKDALLDIRKKLNLQFSNLAVSQLVRQPKLEAFYRISFFLTNFNEFLNNSKRLELDELLNLVQKVNPALIIPLVTREEIEEFNDDFEGIQITKIEEFVKLHRFDCNYDSEEEVGSDDEDDDDEDSDDDSDDDDYRDDKKVNALISKKKKGSKSKAENADEESKNGDEDDNEGDDDHENGDEDDDNEESNEEEDEQDDDDDDSDSDEEDEQEAEKIVYKEKPAE